MKVLIVDDDALNRKILLEALEDGGFEAITASDGLEALDALAANKDVKIILLDRMMPNMDGMEFMKKFSERPEWRNIRVIMQTAANQTKDIIEGNLPNIYYYLTKPFDEEILMTLVRTAAAEIEALEDKQKQA